MKKNYTLYATLLLGMLGFQGIHAQNVENNVERIKQVLTYGDWQDAGKEFGIDTKNLPTQVKDFFYNNRGKLVKTLEGIYQLGDNPTTILDIEKLGDIKPSKFTSYNYNEKDQLVSVSEQIYHSSNGWFYDWNVNDTLKVYAYDNNGKLAEKTEKESKTTYAWQGEQLLSEKTTDTKSGKIINAAYHSEFEGEKSNLPKKTVQVTAEAAYFVANEYDTNQQIVKSTKYTLANPVKDASDAIVNGEKGEPVAQTVYTYAEGRLTAKVQSNWDKANNMFVNAQKEETLWNEAKKGYETVVYTNNNGEWKAEGAPVVKLMGNYDFQTPVGDISVDESGPMANSVVISFKSPTDAPKDIKWNVYRNGEKLGTANFLENSWQYFDNEVTNGNYDYYVMADTINSPGYKAISNVVSYHFEEESQKVDKINVVESGKTTVKSENGEAKEAYAYRLTWNTPNTNKTILGYNVYLNTDPAQPGAKAHNKKLITTPFYELVMDNCENIDNNVIVEVVYRTGYTHSAATKVTLDPAAEINQQNVRKVQKVVTFGNSMGSVDSATRSKEKINYYDADNKLVMTVLNGFITGDDPDTKEVEKAGDYLPIQYIVYNYNEKGQLINMKGHEYGTYSGYDRAWSKDFDTLESFEYDDKTGKMTRHAETSRGYEYVWEGDRIVEEHIFTTRGNGQLGKITYSNFSDKGKNLPQYGLGISTNSMLQNYNRIYEFDYDEKGHLIEKRTYKHGDNAEKNDKGEIIKVDKGTLHEKLTYEYEGDMLKTMVKYTYKSSIKSISPYSKTVYTQTANGLREQNYTYTNVGSTDGWTESSMHTEEVESNYLGSTAPGKLTVSDIEGKNNCVLLTCDAPQKVYGEDVVYEAYRNGVKLGTATVKNGKLVYEDNLVPNGLWHYLIKPASKYEGVDFCSTNVVEKNINTVLPKVTKITFPVNGVKENGDYQLIAEWEAPESEFDILGYNVFVDVRKWTKNPTPVNGLYELEKDVHKYEFSWMSYVNKEKSIMIETVYPVGKAKSDPFIVNLSGDPVGIISHEQTHHLVTAGNHIVVNGTYKQLGIYAANGACVGQYSNTSSVDLTALPDGVYVVKLITAQGVETLKVVKK